MFRHSRKHRDTNIFYWTYPQSTALTAPSRWRLLRSIRGIHTFLGWELLRRTLSGFFFFLQPPRFSSNNGTGTRDCKLSSSNSRCSGVYQHDQGASSVVPVCYRPNIACGAYLHHLSVQCASFTFGAFLGNIYNRISYHGMYIAPIVDCVGWNSAFTVLGWRPPFTFPPWGPATNALFLWSSYKLSYRSSFRYLVLSVFPWCMYYPLQSWHR